MHKWVVVSCLLWSFSATALGDDALAIVHVTVIDCTARQAVRDLKAKGVDFIKVHNALPPEAFFALMDEARKERMHVAVHLPRA